MLVGVVDGVREDDGVADGVADGDGVNDAVGVGVADTHAPSPTLSKTLSTARDRSTTPLREVTTCTVTILAV